MAMVPAIPGETEMFEHFFADTICGLIEYLDKNKISPDEAELFGVYRQQEIPLDITYCTDEDGRWLSRPDICHSLEKHFEQTLEEQYLGHVDKGACSFEDRERRGTGPF